MKTYGVYFSANDAVYEWVVPFLNSFRTFNPDLKLILIPFNDRCDRLLKLQEKMDFDIYFDLPSFQKLEAIGQAFELGHTPTGPYWFRRYASFWGSLDRFLYLDARQVILANLEPIINALDTYGFELLHFDCNLDQVYQAGELRRNFLKQGKARGFNSGRWASCKGLFSLGEFEQLSVGALRVRDQLNPRNTDQAFINYCCDIKAVQYAHIADVMGNVCQVSWAKQPGVIFQKKGKYFLWDYRGNDHKKQLILVHWAGYPLSASMPQKHLFNTFLIDSRNIIHCSLFLVKEFLLWMIGSIFNLLRKNRLINCFYHNYFSHSSNSDC